MKNLSINKDSLILFVRRYSLVMFIVAIAALLSVSVLLLYNIVNKASGDESTPQNGVITSFDQPTIDRIDQLKTSDEPSEPLDLSQGRINPFSE